MAVRDITLERVRELVHYDPQTGIFTNIKRRKGAAVGAIAGSASKRTGYRRIRLDYQHYSAHRLAIFYMTGEWPVGEVDHINGEKTDNRFSNLRAVKRSLNSQNQRRAQSRNKIGLLGVHLRRARGTFIASIMVNNRKKYLGSYKTPEEAHNAYLEAKRKLHEGCTI